MPYFVEVERALFAEILFEVCVVPCDAVGGHVVVDGGFEVFDGGCPFFVVVTDYGGVECPEVGFEIGELGEVFKKEGLD